MDNKKDTLFISYSWNDGNVIADELESELTDYFDVKRDKSQLKYNEDMYDFMAEIANCDYVVVILTAKYIQSVNCMLEASYLVQQPDWKDKAMVLVVDESIYSTDRKLELLKYWHDRKENAKHEESKLGRTIVDEEYKNIEEIDANLEAFLYGIARKRNPTQITIVNEFVRKQRNKKVDDKDPIMLGRKKVREYIDSHGPTTVPEVAKALGFSPAFTSRLIKSIMDDMDKNPMMKEGMQAFLANKQKMAAAEKKK